MANWNETGYDLNRSTRWLYAFLDAEQQRVKVGLVLTEERLPTRLREVARKHRGVVQVAATPLPDVTHQEAVHIESVVRHWLSTTHEFDHAGLVDWLDVPDPPPGDWQLLLDSAVQAAVYFRNESATPLADSPDVNPLPALEDFNDDERLLARFVVGAIHGGGTMFEGRLYECHLSRLLDADLPPRGVWPWDLRLRDHDDPAERTRIEVRSGAEFVKIGGGRNADVWIFVRKATSPSEPPLSYHVAPNHRVVTLRSLRAKHKLREIEEQFGAVRAEELKSAVAVCARDERNHRQRLAGTGVS